MTPPWSANRYLSGADRPRTILAVLLVASIVLPSITSAEFVTFTIAGVTLNVRVAIYFVLAGLAVVTAVPIVLSMRPFPCWLQLMLAMLAWLGITSLIGRQSPVEWLPTVVRFALYFSTVVVAYRAASSLQDAGARSRLARYALIAVVAAGVLPALVGLGEFLLGTAPLLNGARRVSGSMPFHPVAFSLVLALSALAAMGPAIVRGVGREAVGRWVLVAFFTAVVFTTYTRLAILLIVVLAALVALLLPGRRDLQVKRFGAVGSVGLAVLLLAQPAFDARFTHGTPLSVILDRTGGCAPSCPPGGAPPDSDSGLDPQLDGSAAYRVLLTRKALEFFAQSPLVGHGPGSFDRLYEEQSGRARVAAHNDVLSLAVETGAPGAILFAATLLLLVRAMWRRRGTPDRDSAVLLVTALVALIGFNVGATIHNTLYFVEIQLPIWILVGLALGFAGAPTPVEHDAPPGEAAA